MIVASEIILTAREICGLTRKIGDPNADSPLQTTAPFYSRGETFSIPLFKVEVDPEPASGVNEPLFVWVYRGAVAITEKVL